MTALFFLIFMLPYVGLVLFAVPFSTVFLLGLMPSVTFGRMAKGYFGAILASLVAALPLSHTPYEASESYADSRPETYSLEFWINFQVVGDMLVLYALTFVAIVVAPLTFAMVRRGFGAVTWVVISAGLVSLILVPLLLLAYRTMSILNAGKLFGVNLLLASSFSLGFGLPLLRAPVAATPSLPRGLQ